MLVYAVIFSIIIPELEKRKLYLFIYNIWGHEIVFTFKKINMFIILTLSNAIGSVYDFGFYIYVLTSIYSHASDISYWELLLFSVFKPNRNNSYCIAFIIHLRAFKIINLCYGLWKKNRLQKSANDITVF